MKVGLHDIFLSWQNTDILLFLAKRLDRKYEMEGESGLSWGGA